MNTDYTSGVCFIYETATFKYSLISASNIFFKKIRRIRTILNMYIMLFIELLLTISYNLIQDPDNQLSLMSVYNQIYFLL